MFSNDDNVFFEFHPHQFLVKYRDSRIPLLIGMSSDGIYSMSFKPWSSSSASAFSATKVSAACWHLWLGHSHQKVLSQVLSRYNLSISSFRLTNLCIACQLDKSHKLSLSLHINKNTSLLQLIFADVCSPSSFLSSQGHCFLLVFVVDFSGYTWCYPFFWKCDVLSVFTQFQVLVRQQFSTKIKSLQIDGGGEFRPLSNLCVKLGIVHRLSCPHNHEQEGKVEHKHRHIVETGLSLMAHSPTPSKCWNFAFETAIYLINHLPTQTNNCKSPFEVVFHTVPDYHFLEVFGCLRFPYVGPCDRHKINFRSNPFVFFGYSPTPHGYTCSGCSISLIQILIYHYVYSWTSSSNPLGHLDIQNAFLHGELHENAYMAQLPGFAHPQFPTHLQASQTSLQPQASSTSMLQKASSVSHNSWLHHIKNGCLLFIYCQGNSVAYLVVYWTTLFLLGIPLPLLKHSLKYLAAACWS